MEEGVLGCANFPSLYKRLNSRKPHRLFETGLFFLKSIGEAFVPLEHPCPLVHTLVPAANHPCPFVHSFVPAANTRFVATKGNTAFPNPPVDLAAFLVAITTFAASVVVALDGSKQAKAIKNKQREGLVKMVEQLGHYVQAASNNDPVTFTSSGFQMRSTNRSPLQSLDQPVIDHLDQGKSGELLAIVKPVPDARTYEIQYAPAVTGGAFPVWTKITVATVRKPVPIENLTPGTTYTFQVRAFGNPGSPTGTRQSSVCASSTDLTNCSILNFHPMGIGN
jgi:hypothetical protein